jgi:hypothetical protein
MKKVWELAIILALVYLHSLSASENPQNAESLTFTTNEMARTFGENTSSEHDKGSLLTSLETSRAQGAGKPRRPRGRPKKATIGQSCLLVDPLPPMGDAKSFIQKSDH